MNNNQAIAVVDNTAVELTRRASDVAGLCKEIVVKTSMSIQGRKYVRVEGWQSIATAHGCVASCRDVKRVEGGFVAIGEIRRMADGSLLATAEGFVGEDEPTWFGGSAPSGKVLPKRPDYAIRAMAQTRAISRVCRSCFAHVVVLMDAGLSTTPAEEVPEGWFQDAEVVPVRHIEPVRVVTPQGAPRVQAAPRPAAPAPTPAAAADSWLPPEKGNDGDLGPATGGWESTVVYFGKNKGQTLGQLAPNSLRWYCENFTVKTTKDDGSERPANWVATDTAFRNALDAAQQSMMG